MRSKIEAGNRIEQARVLLARIADTHVWARECTISGWQPLQNLEVAAWRATRYLGHLGVFANRDVHDTFQAVLEFDENEIDS